MASWESSQNKKSGIALLNIRKNGTKKWIKKYSSRGLFLGTALQRISVENFIILGHKQQNSLSKKQAVIICVDSKGKQIWKKIFHSSLNLTLNNALPVQKDFFVVGTYSRHKKQQGFLLKMSKRGKLIWQKKIRSRQSLVFTNLLWYSKEKMIICGYKKINKIQQVVLTLISKSGKIIRENLIKSDHALIPLKIKSCSKKDYIIAGYTLSNKLIKPWIMKVNSKGQKKWLQYSKILKDGAFNFYTLKNGGCLLFSSAWPKNTSSYYTARYFYDSSGSNKNSSLYSGSSSARVQATTQTANGSYIILAKKREVQGFWIFIVNKRGKLVRKIYYDDQSNLDPRSVLETKKGNWVILGNRSKDNDYRQSGWLLKINKKGKKIWEKSFTSELIFREAKRIKMTARGDYIVILQNAGRNIPPHGSVVLVRKNGEILWDNSYTYGKRNGFMDVIEASDGGFVLTGFIMIKKERKIDSWVVKLSHEGRLLWKAHYGWNKIDYCHNIYPTHDGGYYLLGTTNTFPMFGYDIWLIKVNKNGEKEWTRSWGGKKTDQPASLIHLNNKTLLVLGNTESYGAGKRDIWITNMTKNGKILWKHTIGGAYNDIIYESYRDKRGDIIIIGNTQSKIKGLSTIWISKQRILK